MPIVQCTSCEMRVLPTADGRCPSCQGVIEVRPSSTPSASAPGAAGPSPRDRPTEAPADSATWPPPEDDFEIVVYASRLKALLLLGVGIFPGVVGLVFMTMSLKGLIVGIVLCLGAGAVILISIGKLLNGRPAVLVNREGIVDNASPIGVGLVKWSEIRELSIFQSNEGFKLLAIDVYHPEKILSRVAGVRGVMARFEGSGTDRPPISIPQTFLSMTVEELLDRIAQNVKVPVRRS